MTHNSCDDELLYVNNVCVDIVSFVLNLMLNME